VASFWCESAVVDGVVAGGVRIEHSSGVIDRVEIGAPPRDSDARLDGLVLPGLANGHSHSFHRALRGRTHADGGTFWTWREQMYRIAGKLDPDSYFELASAVFGEMVLAGYTAVGEFHYVHHQPDGTPYEGRPAMEDAVVAAATAAGIRLTLLDTLYLAGGIEADGTPKPLEPAQRRFGDGSVERWAERLESVATGDLTRIGAAIHSVRAVPPELFPRVREVTEGVPVHAHVSEQPAENEASIAAWGATPTRLFADVGLLGPLFTAVHGTHLTEADVRMLGSSRSTVCFCPTTERDLADGIGDARALLRAGATISLGSDQNAVIDPFEELRGLEMDDRLASGSRGRFTPAQLLESATGSGYDSLGWNGGRIAAGSVCDLVAVDTASPRTAGADPDQLWLAATSADVRTVIVGGVVRMADPAARSREIAGALTSAIGRLNR
jgi:formiminoglutamate deiminase